MTNDQRKENKINEWKRKEKLIKLYEKVIKYKGEVN